MELPSLLRCSFQLRNCYSTCSLRTIKVRQAQYQCNGFCTALDVSFTIQIFSRLLYCYKITPSN